MEQETRLSSVSFGSRNDLSSPLVTASGPRDVGCVNGRFKDRLNGD